jgi:hypothetical protein
VGTINAGLYALNAGVVDAEALGRIDLAKMRLAAEEQTNLLPTVLGPAKFRPGTAYHTRTKGDLEARLIPFVFNINTKAKIELTDGTARILIDGIPVTRPAVTAAVTNGSFGTDLTGWTDEDESGTASEWATGGYMSLLGNGSNYAIRRQQVTVTETGVEHALRIEVARGPVLFKVGSASGLENYIAETSLRAGTHSLAFTPSTDFHITISSNLPVVKLVSSVTVEAAGIVELPTPWSAGVLSRIRHDQSGDVLFCACDGIRQQRIERRSMRSWSIVEYLAEDGPFRFANSTPVTITPSDVTGNITLTASKSTFRPEHVGALWRLTHFGQTATAVLSGDDQYTDPVRVAGIDDADVRRFFIEITGTFVGDLKLQRSPGEPGSWEDITTYTGPVSTSFEDDYDNQIIYYRVGFKAGGHTSGTADVTLTYAGSMQDGIVRITGHTTSFIASAEVLTTLGRAEATSNWAEGEWSAYRGFPSAITFHDGRLWWGWKDRVYGSVSDAYESFDESKEGDAGPIIRSVATGGFDRIMWMISIQRLLAGTAAQEVSIRSSSFDEPLTPTQFTARAASDRGSADIQALRVDSRGIYVQRSGKRVFQLAFEVDGQDYNSSDLTRLAPDICGSGVVSIAAQRQPDTRLWFVLEDGTCAVLTYEPSDEVVAWTPVVTSAGSSFKSVCVLPGDIEDEVWFVVERPVSSTTRHYVEKLARADECTGATLSRNMDSYLVYSGASTTTITGLTHLIGQEVVVWGNGGPLVTPDSPLTVNGSGEITLPSAVTNAVIGLAYEAKFRSTKLAYAAQAGTALLMKKRVSRLGLLMANVGWKGIRFGRDFNNLHGLASTYKGKTLTAGQVLTEYDDTPSSFDGKWDTDSRVCMSISSPYPATILGMVIGLETNEGLSLRQPQGG